MLILNAGAVFRLSILVTQDVILDRPRNWFTSRYQGALVTLIQCVWCISFWLAIAAVLLTRVWWQGWQYAAAVLTLSAVAGFLGERV